MTGYDSYVGDYDSLGAWARAVRRAVFVAEQGIAAGEEWDGEDEAATHVVVTDDDTPVATARFRFRDETTVKIERVAVLADYRGEGLGRHAMGVVESRATDEGATEALLHSQERVRPFYEGLGYEPVGDQFDEAGIPHRKMVKDLNG